MKVMIVGLQVMVVMGLPWAGWLAGWPGQAVCVCVLGGAGEVAARQDIRLQEACRVSLSSCCIDKAQGGHLGSEEGCWGPGRAGIG